MSTCPLKHPDGEAAAGLLEELGGLVRIAARRPDLVVQAGEPGCPWAFDFEADVVTVDPDSLRSLAPDLCRGLALHEAAHAAVTVLHRIVTTAVLDRLLPLLNTIEDVRIEVWMRARFPGATDWVRAYNDVFYGLARRQPVPQSRQVQFLKGVFDLWWYGTTQPGTLPEVEAALAACRDAIAAAVGCQPPLDDEAAGVLASQRAMWEIVRDRIVPTWERLVALDRREGIERLALQEMRALEELHGGCRGRRGRPRLRAANAGAVRTIPAAAARPATDAGARTVGDLRQDIASSLGTDGADAYLAAWKRIAPLADRLGDELLRILVPRRRMRWVAGHPSGPRLDLRRAMQFEADPRLHDSLWCRSALPARVDPAVVVLLDRSGSMRNHGLVDRAFEGLVLMVEVCRRVGVPVAAWTFADRPREDLSWDAPLDRAARRTLGRIPHTCDGATHMAAALDAVGRTFTARQADPKLLFVLGDGEPTRAEATHEAVGRLETAGVSTIALGLGAGTAGLATFFRCAATEVPPERIVARVAGLLEAALSGRA